MKFSRIVLEVDQRLGSIHFIYTSLYEFYTITGVGILSSSYSSSTYTVESCESELFKTPLHSTSFRSVSCWSWWYN